MYRIFIFQATYANKPMKKCVTNKYKTSDSRSLKGIFNDVVRLMVTRNPSLNWEKLQDVFYRNREICTLQWPVEEELRYAISTTVIAIELRDFLQIFDYNGNMIISIDKSQFKNVIRFEFDGAEQLVVATPNSVTVVTQFKPLAFKTCRLSENIQDSIWDYKSGLIIMQQSQDIYKLTGSSIELLLKNEGQYTLLTKEHWNSNGNKAILLDVQHVYELEINEAKMTKILSDAQWHRVVLSPNNFICLFNVKFNKLQVFKSSSRILLEHTLEETPKGIKWCGDDTIACGFLDEIKLYGPGNSYVAFWFPQEIAALHTEIDGLKVFTEESVQFISKVEKHTSNTFKIGSTESSAILLDSLDLLEENAARAIENLKTINLKQAVTDCIEASKEELDPQLRKRLLSAASFGKASLSTEVFNSDLFVEACSVLRLLSLLKALEIHLTVKEYSTITLPGLITILLRRQEHYKCIMICQAVNSLEQLPTIFTHWAISKIKYSKDSNDGELYSSIKEQYYSLPDHIKAHISEIFNTAYLEGRFALSRNLALLEYSPEMRIAQLLQLDENSMALREALKMQCPELSTSLIFNFCEKLTTAQLAKLLIMDMPTEQLYPYIFRADEKLLYDYYRQTDRFVDLAHLILLQSKNEGSIRIFLPQVQELYSKILNNNLIKQDTELIQRQEKIWIFQETLTANLGSSFSDLTLDQTLSKLIEMRQEKHTQSLIKKFKVNEKKFYHIKIGALVEKKMFNDLYQFAISKKSPVGYEPFYKCLMRKGYKGEASIYISLISTISYGEKIEMYVKCKAFEEAIQLAGKERDIKGLKELYKKMPANDPQLKSLINEYMSKI
ncbi:hypothetical protein HG535_0C01420 [Zygotorulaspora mrakii]|uniref:Probable vacuolar protein sorting-associated protein 16 homolog n=1 Tax=Zygotorulaspora mrakii TaxID=42260 RepID=A0A7H9AZY2_ZYGMR|nr:uncharacterized protein HG535_0C01420 [Zygotorulaspora mrakii]QLG71793.1 hypothetical protein HG535_0C01420 [Zygotorulaspora mrakii]